MLWLGNMLRYGCTRKAKTIRVAATRNEETKQRQQMEKEAGTNGGTFHSYGTSRKGMAATSGGSFAATCPRRGATGIGQELGKSQASTSSFRFF